MTDSEQSPTVGYRAIAGLLVEVAILGFAFGLGVALAFKAVRWFL